MRIGINALYLIPGKVGGTETYLRNLIRELGFLDQENQYFLFTNQLGAGTFLNPSANWEEVVCPFSPLNKIKRVYWEQYIFPRWIRKYHLDVLHSPGYVSPLHLPCAGVVTIHDMHYYYYPETFSWLKRKYWQSYIPKSARQVQRVITVSHHAQSDVVKILGIPQSRVAVTLEAAGEEFYRDYPEKEVNQFLIKKSLPQPYILSVATFNRHKNLDGVVRVFNQIKKQSDIPHHLVMVGIKGDYYPIVKQEIDNSPYKDFIHVLDPLPIEELPYLYRGADLFVLLSYFEGFGLPVLEAMACGIPVLCSNRTSLPEIAGAAGCIVDPDRESEVAERMVELLKNPGKRQEMSAVGKDWSRQFSWQKMAQETLVVYRDAVQDWKTSKLS